MKTVLPLQSPDLTDAAKAENSSENAENKVDTQTRPRHKRFGFFGFLEIILGILFATLAAMVSSARDGVPEMCGDATATLLVSGLIAYAIAGRRSVRNLRRFSSIFGTLCLLILVNNVHKRESLKDGLSRLAKEAAGTQPIKDTASSTSSTKMDRLLRNALREMLDLRKSYEAESANFKDGMAAIYSAGSFSSGPSAQRMMDALRGSLSVEEAFSHKIQGFTDRFKQQVQDSSLSASDKQRMMKGADQSRAALTLKSLTHEATAKWLRATIDLYTFALANIDRITVDGSKIAINDDEVRARFNHELEGSITLLKAASAVGSQHEQLQREGMQKFGLTPQDLGIGEDNKSASR